MEMEGMGVTTKLGRQARSRWNRSSAGVRRIVLALCAVVNLSHAAMAVQAKPQNQASSQELRGVWFTANDMPVLRDRGRMQAAVNQLADLGFNRLYVVVWNSGLTYYPSQVSQQRQLQDFTFRGLQGQDYLGDLMYKPNKKTEARLMFSFEILFCKINLVNVKCFY